MSALPSVEEWEYRGEGGANLVIRLGPEQRVLRFAKTKYADKAVDLRVAETVVYANEVLRPLIGACYVRPLHLSLLDESDFERVRLEVQQFRPSARCKKDLASRLAIGSHDCVLLNAWHESNTRGATLSFEIKPKQGWSRPHVVDICPRCLKQQAKVLQGEIDVADPYCPLDLFSGDASRMRRAINDLVHHPGNKFKLFRDGVGIYNENVGDIDSFAQDIRAFATNSQDEKAMTDRDALSWATDLLTSALLAPLADPGQINKQYCYPLIASGARDSLEVTEGRTKRRGCDFHAKPLPKYCILQRILALQQLGGDVNDQEAQAISDRLTLTMSGEQLGLHLWKVDDESSSRRPLLSESELEDVARLQRFLLSVTAKDISLLITFRYVDDPSMEQGTLPAIKLPNGQLLRVMISVIDLDPKPVHRIPAWVQSKEEWLRVYTHANNSIECETKESQ